MHGMYIKKIQNSFKMELDVLYETSAEQSNPTRCQH